MLPFNIDALFPEIISSIDYIKRPIYTLHFYLFKYSNEALFMLHSIIHLN